jgi:hypothetical protein
MFEEPKYRAEIFKIAGIAFMTPFGKLLINPFSLYKNLGPVEFIYFILVSLFFAFIGLLFIEQGRVIIHYWERKSWKK